MFSLVRGLSSPAILIVLVWCAALIGVAIGPVDYPMQPTPVVLTVVAAGVSLFILSYWAGMWSFDAWSKRRASVLAPSIRVLNRVVVVTSLVGVVGIGLMAFDRLLLSGISNSGYAELLRCAPSLVDFIEIKRTPLLYAGYLTFSFGFVSLVLFLLKGEEITGWAAILAQFSLLSPVGYALLYSGRMPILFAIVLIASAMLVRVGQGRWPWPRGHHLLLKMVFVVLLFASYSSSIWSRRQTFCNQMTGLVQELQQRQKVREVELKERPKDTGPAIAHPRPADSITATDLSKWVEKRVERANELPAVAPQLNSVDSMLATMKESWGVKPRAYVMSALESGRLSPSVAMTTLSTYFYLTHGVRTIDITWHAREHFTPQWGLYEIGVVSPILRVFFPYNQQVAVMDEQLHSSLIYGFFPSVWVAAFVDFGLAGSIIYVLVWGFVAGWSAFGARRSALATPLLLLVFTLATVLLSPVQGALGLANSALVLLSMIAVGMAIDLVSLRMDSPRQSGELKFGAAG